MGIGAGWYEQEWRAYGYGFPTAGERLARLREGVDIFRQAWTTGSATLAGEHYQVDGALCHPRPLQGTSLPGSPANGIPIWIAGGGERKTLRIAAEYADYTNFDGTPEVFERKSALLREHCDAVGRDVADIVRSANFNVVIGESEKEVSERLAWLGEHLRRSGLDASRVEQIVAGAATQPAVGTPEQITERLIALRDLGMGYAITYFAEAAYDLSGIELFERAVMPELLDAAPEPHHRRWHLPGLG